MPSALCSRRYAFIPLFFMLLVLPLQPANAAQVTLAWDQNPEPDITGYKAHYDTYRGNYEHTVDVGNYTECVISGLVEGTTYYFAVTAYNTQNIESDYSNEVDYRVPLAGQTDIVIEAEDMPIKTTGVPISGGWNIYSNGYIADNVDFAAGGVVSFEVISRGSYAGGAWPIMEIRIDQTPVGTVTVDSSSWAAYTIQASITAGTHEVAIAFTNDYYNSPDDRNLYVDKVTITAAGGNLSPEASIMADSINGTVPLLVNFDGSGSHDPDGKIISYDWDFGDGTIDSGDTVSHIFSDPGVYTVTLTVTDDQGATGSDTIQITASSGSGVGALVIEAEDATIKTAGGLIDGNWCLWSNGTLGESISIPAAGTYEVVVRAYGSPLGGIWPEMALSVDGVGAETVTVDSTEYMDYVFQVDITPGIHTIGVSFLNDAWNPGVEDRNLYLDRFTIISPPGIGSPELAP